jgi:aminobenzoyl-glutamate utilization protein B
MRHACTRISALPLSFAIFLALAFATFLALASLVSADGGTTGKDSITPPPAAWSQAKRGAIKWIDDHAAELEETNRKVWEWAEPGMLEYRSAAYLSGLLEARGFEVERGVAGLPTAFTARYGSGEPVIGILAEYDALGGLSQQATTEKTPRVEGGAGHGCGHSLFAAGSLGAAQAVADAIDQGRATGTVVVFGTPNEEGVVGKAYMARDGVFDGLDAALHWHPADRNEVPNGETGNDLDSFAVAFYGRAAHSATSPWKGLSALDAVELMGVMSNYYREHIHPSARIHYVILKGGNAPNVVPEYAKIWYYLRGASREMVEEISERHKLIAEAAALATGTRYEMRLFTAVNHLRDNTVAAKLLHANLQLIGAPQFSDAEHAFAREIQRAVGLEEKGLPKEIEPLKRKRERDLRSYVGFGSTDVAEVSLIAPTAGLLAGTFVKGTPGHNWANVACAGSSIGEKGMLVAAKVLAATTLDMMANPETVSAMRAEFEEMTGGEPYRSPIPKDVRPPILPNPYENPDWTPGDLDYPTWGSFSWEE